MARNTFGGVMASWAVSSADISGVNAVVLPGTAVTLTIYDAPDGAVITDMLDADGAAMSELVLPAGNPYIPKFSGPDGVATLWVQAAAGSWLPVPRFDDGTTAGGGGGGVGDVLLAGGNAFEYANSQDPDPWLRVDIPDDASDSSAWSNRLEFRFWDDTTSQYRHGFHVNEKSLLRTRGTTPTDVPVRFMAHPAQAAGTALVELTLSDNTQKLFQQLLSLAVFGTGVQVPYVQNPNGERLYFGSADPNTDAAYANHRPRTGDAWFDYNGA